jgi:RNA polymerase sigma-70 factor (ECF subfamily)
LEAVNPPENAFMSPDALPIPADALLQHRGFVRSLARSLAHDEHAAEDLAQETWLAALRRPPRSTEALRSWLGRVLTNRARNTARTEARRVARERFVARTEIDESETSTRDRVLLQQRIVAAVLELPEPYRTVVLLRYDQDLAPSQIAARRKLPPGTIRSQLSRAHEMLRQKLDGQFGGSRAAWLVPLASFTASRGSTLAVGKTILLLGGVALLIAGLSAIALRSDDTAVAVSSAVRPLADSESDTAATLDAPIPRAPSREPVPQDPRRALGPTPSRDDLEDRTISDLLVLGQQVQRALRERLLTPDRGAAAIASLLARVPDAQVARLLPYGRIEGDIDGRFLGIRGAGACWSFATASNDYDRQPDVLLSGGSLGTVRFGGTTGWIHDLDRFDLAEIPSDPASPFGRDSRTREIWSLAWEDAHIAGRDYDRSLDTRAIALGLSSSAPPGIGHTYLLRTIQPGEHDLLAAFSVLDRDEYGYTIAGRVLHRWPLPEGSVEAPRTFPVIRLPEDPFWMRGLDVPALLELSHEIRAVGEAKLLAVPEALAKRFAEVPQRDDRGLVRLLHRFRYDAITVGRERGAFFTFLTRSSAYDGYDDLRFEADRLSVAGRGALIDLGSLDFDLVERAGSISSGGLSSRAREAHDLLESAQHARLSEDLAAGRVFEKEADQRIAALALWPVVPSVLGHTYLLRSVVPSKHDVLVAFSVVGEDDSGVWIRWILLRTWPVDHGERK